VLHEPIYIQKLSESDWKIGYLLDRDECELPLVFGEYTGEQYWTLELE
jgi:hypothetical protein